jgi:hypothetical protein
MTRITKGMWFSPAPGGDRFQPSSTPGGTRHRWAGVAVVITAGVVLAVATLPGDAEDDPVGPPLAAEHGSPQPVEGPAEDPAGPPGGEPTCSWTSEINTPVLPAENLGGPPTPVSVLVFERCDGEWTGNIAWLNAGAPDTGPEPADPSGSEGSAEGLCSSVRADAGVGALVDPSGGLEPTGGDSGFVNPWAAGNAAAARYLSELCRGR